MPLIYVVEDDQSIRDIILYTLQSCSFEAKGFEEGDLFLKEIQEQEPDLVLMDIMLPNRSGIEILKQIRQGQSQVPIIMTTARSMEMDIIQALDLGADDYLVKPFGMMEMVARIKAVLRRSEAVPKEVVDRTYELDGLFMDTRSHSVTYKGEILDLTVKEYEMLRLFLSHPGKAFSREDLMNLVWQTDFAGETRTIDVHVRGLRSKLKEAGEWIETVRGVGYRMKGTV